MELRLGLFFFGLKLGLGVYRAEFDISTQHAWFRLPWVGQGNWYRGSGPWYRGYNWAVDRWPEAKHEDQSWYVI